MGKQGFAGFIEKVAQALLAVNEISIDEITPPKRVLIIRQHNQLGDMLASVPLFRALKQNYPDVHITLVVSPENKAAVAKNKFIDEIINFDKKKLLSIAYLISLYKKLRKGYDWALVPVVVSISFTSNLLARLSKSKIRIGPASLNGKENSSAFFFNIRIPLDWRNAPNRNVYMRAIDFVKSLKIVTDNFRTEISFDNQDSSIANAFLEQHIGDKNNLIIGLHPGAGKPPNRWAAESFIGLIDWLRENYNATIYLTGTKADNEVLKNINSGFSPKLHIYYNHTVAEVAALVSKSHLYITNDTGAMHIAGATETPQISLFGPTNPAQWAPPGLNKLFIHSPGDVNAIELEKVKQYCIKFLGDPNAEESTESNDAI